VSEIKRYVVMGDARSNVMYDKDGEFVMHDDIKYLLDQPKHKSIDEESERQGFWRGFEIAVMNPNQLNIRSHWNDYLALKAENKKHANTSPKETEQEQPQEIVKLQHDVELLAGALRTISGAYNMFTWEQTVKSCIDIANGALKSIGDNKQ